MLPFIALFKKAQPKIPKIQKNAAGNSKKMLALTDSQALIHLIVLPWI
jgi:hypothetical protein